MGYWTGLLSRLRSHPSEHLESPAYALGFIAQRCGLAEDQLKAVNGNDIPKALLDQIRSITFYYRDITTHLANYKFADAGSISLLEAYASGAMNGSDSRACLPRYAKYSDSASFWVSFFAGADSLPPPALAAGAPALTPSICGAHLEVPEIGFFCHDCLCDATAYYCKDCFAPADHEGHAWAPRLISGGVCDCGSADACICPCPRHRGSGSCHSQSEHSEGATGDDYLDVVLGAGGQVGAVLASFSMVYWRLMGTLAEWVASHSTASVMDCQTEELPMTMPMPPTPTITPPSHAPAPASAPAPAAPGGRSEAPSRTEAYSTDSEDATSAPSGESDYDHSDVESDINGDVETVGLAGITLSFEPISAPPRVYPAKACAALALLSQIAHNEENTGIIDICDNCASLLRHVSTLSLAARGVETCVPGTQWVGGDRINVNHLVDYGLRAGGPLRPALDADKDMLPLVALFKFVHQGSMAPAAASDGANDVVAVQNMICEVVELLVLDRTTRYVFTSICLADTLLASLSSSMLDSYNSFTIIPHATFLSRLAYARPPQPTKMPGHARTLAERVAAFYSQSLSDIAVYSNCNNHRAIDGPLGPPLMAQQASFIYKVMLLPAGIADEYLNAVNALEVHSRTGIDTEGGGLRRLADSTMERLVHWATTYCDEHQLEASTTLAEMLMMASTVSPAQLELPLQYCRDKLGDKHAWNSSQGPYLPLRALPLLPTVRASLLYRNALVIPDSVWIGTDAAASAWRFLFDPSYGPEYLTALLVSAGFDGYGTVERVPIGQDHVPDPFSVVDYIMARNSTGLFTQSRLTHCFLMAACPTPEDIPVVFKLKGLRSVSADSVLLTHPNLINITDPDVRDRTVARIRYLLAPAMALLRESAATQTTNDRFSPLIPTLLWICDIIASANLFFGIAPSDNAQMTVSDLIDLDDQLLLYTAIVRQYALCAAVQAGAWARNGTSVQVMALMSMPLQFNDNEAVEGDGAFMEDHLVRAMFTTAKLLTASFSSDMLCEAVSLLTSVYGCDSMTSSPTALPLDLNATRNDIADLLVTSALRTCITLTADHSSTAGRCVPGNAPVLHALHDQIRDLAVTFLAVSPNSSAATLTRRLLAAVGGLPGTSVSDPDAMPYIMEIVDEVCVRRSQNDLDSTTNLKLSPTGWNYFDPFLHIMPNTRDQEIAMSTFQTATGQKAPALATAAPVINGANVCAQPAALRLATAIIATDNHASTTYASALRLLLCAMQSATPEHTCGEIRISDIVTIGQCITAQTLVFDDGTTTSGLSTHITRHCEAAGLVGAIAGALVEAAKNVFGELFTVTETKTRRKVSGTRRAARAKANIMAQFSANIGAVHVEDDEAADLAETQKENDHTTHAFCRGKCCVCDHAVSDSNGFYLANYVFARDRPAFGSLSAAQVYHDVAEAIQREDNMQCEATDWIAAGEIVRKTGENFLRPASISQPQGIVAGPRLQIIPTPAAPADDESMVFNNTQSRELKHFRSFGIVYRFFDKAGIYSPFIYEPVHATCVSENILINTILGSENTMSGSQLMVSLMSALFAPRIDVYDYEFQREPSFALGANHLQGIIGESYVEMMNKHLGGVPWSPSIPPSTALPRYPSRPLINPKSVVQLQTCGHMVHAECLRQLDYNIIRTNFGYEKVVSIKKCPLCNAPVNCIIENSRTCCARTPDLSFFQIMKTFMVASRPEQPELMRVPVVGVAGTLFAAVNSMVHAPIEDARSALYMTGLAKTVPLLLSFLCPPKPSMLGPGRVVLRHFMQSLQGDTADQRDICDSSKVTLFLCDTLVTALNILERDLADSSATPDFFNCICRAVSTSLLDPASGLTPFTTVAASLLLTSLITSNNTHAINPDPEVCDIWPRSDAPVEMTSLMQHAASILDGGSLLTLLRTRDEALDVLKGNHGNGIVDHLPQDAAVALAISSSQPCKTCGQTGASDHYVCLRCGDHICSLCYPSQDHLNATMGCLFEAVGRAPTIVPVCPADPLARIASASESIPRRGVQLLAHATICGGAAGCAFLNLTSTVIMAVSHYDCRAVGYAHVDATGDPIPIYATGTLVRPQLDARRLQKLQAVQQLGAWHLLRSVPVTNWSYPQQLMVLPDASIPTLAFARSATPFEVDAIFNSGNIMAANLVTRHVRQLQGEDE